MKNLLSLTSPFITLLKLRVIAIIIQLALLVFAQLGLNYQLPLMALSLVIGCELIFTLLSWIWFKRIQLQKQGYLFIQLLADVLFLSLLLYFSGGATNAFVSLLLIPLAISAVLLPMLQVVVLTLISVAAYSIMLWLMPMQVLHGNMQGHFVGMWLNFLLSALVVAVVITQLAQTLAKREQAINQFREQQLKQEQMVALGLASAQVTHELATPLSSMQLLLEELTEDVANNEPLSELEQQLSRCLQSVHQFRQTALKATELQQEYWPLIDFYQQLNEQIRLNHPKLDLIQNSLATSVYDHQVNSNAILLPAVMNLVNNAVRASAQNKSNQLALTWQVLPEKAEIRLTIRDFGNGFNNEMLSQLGTQMVASNQGLGMAVYLSHASLESIGGNIALSNHPSGGAVVTLTLPIVTEEQK